MRRMRALLQPRRESIDLDGCDELQRVAQDQHTQNSARYRCVPTLWLSYEYPWTAEYKGRPDDEDRGFPAARPNELAEGG